MCKTNVQQKIKVWPLEKWAVKKIEKLLQLGEKNAGVNGMVYILCVL